MYDTWHWANQMMLMLIWHTVLLFVSGSKVQKADAPKMPSLWQHCCYLPCLWPANCRHFSNAAEVAARQIQSLVAFSAEKKQHAADFLKRRDWRIWCWIFEGLKGLVIAVQESTRQVVFFCLKFAATVFFFGAENREPLRWQDLEDISLQISGAQCQFATGMDSTSPSTFRSSCLLSLWDDQLLGEDFHGGFS